ncbi:MAG: KOW domain-containing RNA-binding protein [Bacillota bacterium]|nr:KOW domain-containing RNA-binding protein [Bacillota bacterium]HHU61259.1 RNA-binding protein [Natronincola sp.]
MGLCKKGQLVTSRKGRDAGKQYVVIGFYDENHVQVADGYVRKIERPKRKNFKHLIIHQKCLESSTFNDKAIREFIELHGTEEKV